MTGLQVRRSEVSGKAIEGLPRYAAVDIGSNTIKLTIVARTPEGDLLPILDAGATPRLGSGSANGTLQTDNMLRTVHALKECVNLSLAQGVQQVVAVATAAVREARNREEFLQLARDVGVEVDVLSGDDEARLSALAVRSDPRWKDVPHLMVLDIGGGSTELIFDDRAPQESVRHSLPVGVVKLTEAHLRSDPPLPGQVAEVRHAVHIAFDTVTWPTHPLLAVGVGGTVMNMGSVYLASRPELRQSLHGTWLTFEETSRQVNLYASLSNADRKNIPGLDPARSDVILAGALLVEGALCRANLTGLHVSSRGLRWGVLFERFGSGTSHGQPT